VDEPEPDATPDLFASAPLYQPLPGRTRDLGPGFERRLVELSEAVGLALPPPPEDPEQRRRWHGSARHALGRHCQDSPGQEEWFEPLLGAAVLDPDPSLVRLLTWPAVRHFGHRRVMTELIRVLRSGTTAERAGAARAWYAALGLRLAAPPGRTMSAAERQALADSLADLHREWRETAVEVFVTDADLDVRRCILPHLDLRLSSYPPELHARVEEAIHIAHTSDDEYLRHRVEHQVRD
jgi:hypothetical protein